MTERCPDRGCDLQGPEIPRAYAAYYAAGVTHYSRRVGVEVRGLYDGVAYWQCPDCGHRWHRWHMADMRAAVEREWSRIDAGEAAA